MSATTLLQNLFAPAHRLYALEGEGPITELAVEAWLGREALSDLSEWRVARGRGAYVAIPPPATELQKQIVAQVNAAAQVPAGASDFFERHLHDSHAGFWLLGPITASQRLAFITNIKAKKAKYDELLRRAQTPGNPYADQQRSTALAYELNGFERRVLASDASAPGSVPVISDADAADLRANAGTGTGTVTSAALWILGTETRREPHGHGRYRRIFDHG